MSAIVAKVLDTDRIGKVYHRGEGQIIRAGRDEKGTCFAYIEFPAGFSGPVQIGDDKVIVAFVDANAPRTL